MRSFLSVWYYTIIFGFCEKRISHFLSRILHIFVKKQIHLHSSYLTNVPSSTLMMTVLIDDIVLSLSICPLLFIVHSTRVQYSYSWRHYCQISCPVRHIPKQSLIDRCLLACGSFFMIVLFPFCAITYEDDRRVCVLYDRVCIIHINFGYRSRRYWIQLHKFQLTECHHHHFQRRQFWLNFANHIRSSSDFWLFHSVRATLNSTGSSSKHFSYLLQIFVPSTQSNPSKYLTLSHTCLFMNFMLMSMSFSFHSCQLRFFLISTRSLSRCIWESFSFSFIIFFFFF